MSQARSMAVQDTLLVGRPRRRPPGSTATLVRLRACPLSRTMRPRSDPRDRARGLGLLGLSLRRPIRGLARSRGRCRRGPELSVSHRRASDQGSVRGLRWLTISSCMCGSKATHRPRPDRLAQYMATSASLSSAPASSWAGVREAIPTLAPTRTARPEMVTVLREAVYDPPGQPFADVQPCRGRGGPRIHRRRGVRRCHLRVCTR